MLFKGEEKAIQQVIDAGEKYGYGNMISHLKKQWAENLMSKIGFSEELALRAANSVAYPLENKTQTVGKSLIIVGGQALGKPILAKAIANNSKGKYIFVENLPVEEIKGFVINNPNQRFIFVADIFMYDCLGESNENFIVHRMKNEIGGESGTGIPISELSKIHEYNYKLLNKIL